LYVKSKLKIFLQTGDFFGELSLMGKPNRRLNAMAKENSVLLEMNLVAFELVMKERSVVEQLRFTDFVSENFPGFS
jgi:CRP-like cAMP-binding protein